MSNVTFHADRIGLLRHYQRPSGETIATVTVPGQADADVVYVERTIDAQRWRAVVGSIMAALDVKPKSARCDVAPERYSPEMKHTRQPAARGREVGAVPLPRQLSVRPVAISSEGEAS
jgi:hypothetical protein